MKAHVATIVTCTSTFFFAAGLFISKVVCDQDSKESPLLMHRIDFGSARGGQDFYCIGGQTWMTRERDVVGVLRRELVPMENMSCEKFRKMLNEAARKEPLCP